MTASYTPTGKRIGAPVKWTADKNAQLLKLQAEGWKDADIGELLGFGEKAIGLQRSRLKRGVETKETVPMTYGLASSERIHKNVNGKPCTFQRFCCAACQAELDIPLAGSMGAEGYAREATKRGWEAHPLKRARVFCPKCKDAHRPPNDPDSELKKLANGHHPNPEPAVSTVPAAPATAKPLLTSTALTPNMMMASPVATSVGTGSIPPRDLTQDERLKIRGALDRHFDDGIGAYHDDWCDEKVATSIGVPRVHVERLREAAYGPIRLDPVLAGLRSEVAQAKRDVATFKGAIEKMETALMSLSSRIEKRASGKA